MNDLETRMKSYENTFRNYLLPRTPVIIRIDGKSFHTLTRCCTKPFDKVLAEALDKTALSLLKNIQNARFAYVQSDEISILLIDYNKFDSQQWFDGNIQKIVSVSASIATATFNSVYNKLAFFDSRVFILPEREVINYFIWRQQDATRNSIESVAQSLYSPKELYKKKGSQLQEMIFQKGQNWNDLPNYWKRGRVISSDGVDFCIPIFSKNRNYFDKYLKIQEE